MTRTGSFNQIYSGAYNTSGAEHIDHNTGYRRFTQDPSRNESQGGGIAKKVGVLAVTVGALVGGGYGAKEYVDRNREATTSSEVGNPILETVGDPDMKHWELEKMSLQDFNQLPLEERLSYGMRDYTEFGDYALRVINSAVEDDNMNLGTNSRTIESVPQLTTASSPQEILDFMSIAGTLRGMGEGDERPKIGALYIDDYNTAALNRLADLEAQETTKTIPVNTHRALTDSGRYIVDGKTYIDITYENTTRDNQKYTASFEEIEFTSIFDNAEHVAYRSVVSHETP